MKFATLFSGIGGPEIAADELGWESVFHCEWNKFGQKVLHDRWPNSEFFNDITKTDFTKYADRIDVLCGGFPCQPYSVAGKQKGKDDERHLWPQMLRAVKEIRPRWVVGENVHGLINWNAGMVFNEVQIDLETAFKESETCRSLNRQGYEVFPYVLPASGVGAPHLRYRVFFVAYCHNTGNPTSKCRFNENEQAKIKKWEQSQFKSRGSCNKESTPNANSASTEHAIPTGRNMPSSSFQQSTIIDTESGRTRGISNEGGKEGTCNSNELFGIKCSISNAESNAPNTEGERHEHINAGDKEFRSSPKQGLYGGSRVEYGRCRNWDNFPTQPPLRSGNDGFSTESLRQRIREDSMGYLSEKEIDKIISKAHSEWFNESIAAYGNAIVPQLILQIFRAIEEYEKIYLK